MEPDSESRTNPDDLSSYANQPLSPGQIRLLLIEWVPDPSLQHVFPWTLPLVSMKLRTYRVAFEEDMNYEAVSYAWGNEPASVTVTCNERPLLITPTLCEMLLRLGQIEGEFWIDAICIDQGNSKEKATQIPLMHLIYSRAKAVNVWLGPSEPSVTAFMEDLPRVHKLSKSWVHKDRTNDIFWRGEDWPPDGAPFWDGLFYLLHNRWFERLWTFQEVALAKSVYMFSGETWIILHEFLTFFWPGARRSDSYVCPEDRHYEQMPFLVSAQTRARNACHVIAWRHGYERGAPVQAMHLPLMFYYIRQRKVKEKVDRVWAIAGIFPESLRSRLSSKVDYSDDARSRYWKTYLSFAKAVFEGEQTLALLHMPPSARHHNTHLPSWCPDLSADPYELLCGLQIDCNWRRSIKLDTSFWWSGLQLDEQEIARKLTAVVDHPSKLISIDTNNVVLHVRGFVVDTIEEIVDGTDMFPLWKKAPCHDWRYLDPGNVVTRVVIRYFLEGLALAQRTCVNQINTALGLPQEFLRCLFLETCISEKAEKVSDDMFQLLRSFMEGIKPSYRELTAEETHWYTLFWRILLMMTGHSFFATRNGRFGVATPGCKAGDKICVFYSGEPLYILPSEGTGAGSRAVKFGGVAFIPNLMDQDQRDSVRLSPDEVFAIS